MLTAVVRLIVAGLLFTAAALKLYGIVIGALPVTEFAQPAWMAAAIALVEAYAAWAVAVYRSRALPLFAALVLFVILFGFAGLHWSIGSSGCGCFGFVDISPTVTMLVDVTCIVALWSTRPPRFGTRIRREARVWMLNLTNGRALPGLIATIFAAVAVPYILGTSSGRDLVNLPSLSLIAASTSQVAPGPPDSWTTGRVSLINTSSAPAKVVGASATCGCVRVGKLLISIPPHKTVSVTFRIIRPSIPGEFRKTVTFYLNHPDQYLVQADIVGRVVPSD